jgi:hypothetical protein
MRFILSWLQKILIGIIVLTTIWIITIYIFEPLNHRIPFFFAIILTYLIAAYILLPRIVHLSVVVMRHTRIPRSTRTGDGLPADPVNIVLIGSEKALIEAFTTAGWSSADHITLRSSLKMISAFLLNKPYHGAPFSTHYLFARPQNMGFQLPIGNSPRRRHHVRFWGVNYDDSLPPLDGDIVSQLQYWTKEQEVDSHKPMMWIGAAIKDTGVSISKLTYQVTHSVDKKNVDDERDFLLSQLLAANMITNEHYVDSGEYVAGKYISDGRILTATLVTN